MKSLVKIILILGGLQASTFSARADEDSWKRLSITLPTLSNQINGFLTDAGTFRIDEIMPFSARLQITGGYMRGSLDAAVKRCRAQGEVLRITKSTNGNIFEFKGFAYPFAPTELDQLSPQIENQPNLWSVEVSLATKPESITTPASARQFEKSFAGALTQSLAEMKRTGRFHISAAAVDDVVCDLVLGQATLDFRFNLAFDKAKHVREAIISGADFGNLYEELSRKPIKASDSNLRNFVNGALLERTMKEKLGKGMQELGQDVFLRMAGGLYSKDLLSLKSFRPSDYESTARSLDILRMYPTPISLKVSMLLVEL